MTTFNEKNMDISSIIFRRVSFDINFSSIVCVQTLLTFEKTNDKEAF